ncbi:MAG: TIR domain-containing protein, partial [Caulobacteraceae bacterium]
MTAVFISYAKSNESEAKAICEAPRGVGDEVWRDDELPAHRSYAEVIEERLKAAKAVLVIWSAEAIKSQWVQSEADRARNDRKLVQLSIDGATPPMPFDRIHCADMNGWSGEADDAGWLKIVASLTELVGENSPRRESAERSARPESKLSICVLPFANMSDDPQQEYFSDGISEDIITDLSKVSALSVVARNTAFTFKGKAVEVPRLANQLGVSHVLEGSVRKAGGRVRITAQLIDGAAGDHLWAERWDRDLTDIFALQDEISQAIVAALKLRLLPKEKEAIERRGTDNVDSFNLYLMARQQLVAGNVGDATREEAIIRLCSRAVEIDPSYARAWALLAYGQHSLHFVRGRADDDGFAAAEKAISLDPTLAEPHALKGRVLYGLARREEARAEIDLALRLDPEAPEVLTAAGLLALVDQRLEDAERFYSKESLLDERDFSA